MEPVTFFDLSPDFDARFRNLVYIFSLCEKPTWCFTR